MNLKDLTKKTRETIIALAKNKGIAPEEVLSHFRAISLRRKVSKHSRVFS